MLVVVDRMNLLVPVDTTIVFIAIITFLLFISEADVTIHMVTTGGVFAVPQGDKIVMECAIFATEFNLFDNPIVWRKRQLNEDTAVNMMGNLVEPFASTRRLKVTYHQNAPSYIFGLSISETRQEDTGNYSCEISGLQNLILASVTHQLIVRAFPEQIILTTTDGNRVLSHGRETHLTIIEKKPTLLRCTATGGYPPPEIDIYINDRRARDDFYVNRTVALSEIQGLRRIYYETSRWNPYFMVESGDDGKIIKCVVRVPGLEQNTTFAAIEVHFAAIINCDNVSSSVGDRNVILRCEINAKPPPKSLFWVIDDRGTTVREGDDNKLYSVLLVLRTDEFVEAQLILRQANASNFRKYVLVVENPVAVSTRDVILQLKDEFTYRPPQKSNPSLSNPQNLRSSDFSFLQNDATLRHVITFSQLWTLLMTSAIPIALSALR